MTTSINRRQLLGMGAMGAMGATTDATALKQPIDRGKSVFQEPLRKVPIVDQADVVVCGAGPAGVAAALAAARCGAKTRLLEVCGCLGGVWTAGLLCWILDTKDKPGLLHEMLAKLKQKEAGYVNSPGYSFGYDAEVMKLLLEEMCGEAGIQTQLHTRVVAAVKDQAKRLRLAITESKSGRQAWGAKVFVDATGDGDLAAQAGCGFDLGREKDHGTQPMSMMAVVAGPHYEEIKQFVRRREANHNEPKLRLFAEMKRAGVTPSYSKPTLFRIYDQLYCLATNHEYGVLGIDAADVTRATIQARAEVHKLVDGLRSLSGVWQNLRIVATNEQIGVREGRRIHGLYTVSTEDLLRGARHEDAICRTYFVVDVHSVKKSEGTGITRTGVSVKPYDIPLRALIARDVKGLLTAGRCISGDFLAHSSYRVTGNSVAMGQAAGVTAALAAQGDSLPHELPWSQIKTQLDRFDTVT